jgi:hypothetical protein
VEVSGVFTQGRKEVYSKRVTRRAKVPPTPKQSRSRERTSPSSSAPSFDAVDFLPDFFDGDFGAASSLGTLIVTASFSSSPPRFGILIFLTGLLNFERDANFTCAPGALAVLPDVVESSSSRVGESSGSELGEELLPARRVAYLELDCANA